MPKKLLVFVAISVFNSLRGKGRGTAIAPLRGSVLHFFKKGYKISVFFDLKFYHKTLNKRLIALFFLGLITSLLTIPAQANIKTPEIENISDRSALQSPISNNRDSALQLAQTLNERGRLQLATGHPEDALITWEKATEAYQFANDSIGITGSLINQAQALQAMGLYLRSLKTLERSQQFMQEQPDSALKATGLRSIGNALRAIGKLDESKQILQESLEIAKRLPSNQATGEILLSLGNTARAQQEVATALTFYQQAAEFSEPTTRLQAQLNQLSLLVKTQQWLEAQELAPQIQEGINILPPSRSSVYAKLNLAESLRKIAEARGGDGEQGSKGAEEQESKEAGEQGSRGASQLPIPNPPFPVPNSPSLIPTFPIPNPPSPVPNYPKIAQLIATAIQEARSLDDLRAESYAIGELAGLYERSQQWSEALELTQQALIIAQTINAPDIAYQWQWQLGRLLKVFSKNEEAIAAYTEAVNTLHSLRNDLVAINPDIQFSFRDNVEPLYRELVGLLLQANAGKPIQDNLLEARNLIESLQVAELDNFFRDACLDIQQTSIDRVDSTAAIIYPIILSDRLEVILSLPNKPLRHYATPLAGDRVEDILMNLRQALVTRVSNQRFLSPAKQVYDWLIRPFEVDLADSGIHTLVFVPDGAFRNVPMSALNDGKQFLIEKYSVALSPGSQLLAPQPLARGQMKVLIAGLSESRQGFSALPKVELELQQIAAELPSKVLLNQAFTSSALQKQLNSSVFPVVHLATHGEFSSQAKDTFILTWDSRIDVNRLDDLLHIVSQKNSSAIELLVLSACKTAAGDKRAALGLAGVAVRAGARSTLASLWYVNDEATAILMSHFYRGLADEAIAKSEALRRAQLTLLKDRQFSHPIFWAPYVLVGNWL